MKKSNRDLIFSILSVFLIAFLMFAEISSGMAIYADTFHNNGDMPNVNQNNGGDGNINNMDPRNGVDGSGNDQPDHPGDTSADGKDNSADNTNTNSSDSTGKDDMATWGWILAVVAAIVIIAIIAAAVSKKRKTDDKKR